MNRRAYKFRAAALLLALLFTSVQTGRAQAHTCDLGATPSASAPHGAASHHGGAHHEGHSSSSDNSGQPQDCNCLGQFCSAVAAPGPSAYEITFASGVARAIAASAAPSVELPCAPAHLQPFPNGPPLF